MIGRHGGPRRASGAARTAATRRRAAAVPDGRRSRDLREVFDPGVEARFADALRCRVPIEAAVSG